MLQSYVGTSPFDHVADTVDLGLGTAMYDLMGKATGRPVHKLLGTQARRFAPVASWFNATSPVPIAEVVKLFPCRPV